MIVEGQEIDQETVEWFTAHILRQKEPFRAQDMEIKAFRNGLPSAVSARFVDRLFQKLRKARKIQFVGGYWSVVEGA
ncbi:hypothetical protein LV478_11700 [Komagataeibacter oboediens]|uniref:hypothetical protein n=1 Tax=Komagataeibacter oboediens TaxID=65958 RepID=UPI0023DBBBDF|nr:hypothetical protein [Komagataeibacter oboediens]WEQ51194.1 hypothetical protein LV478_11700 [Komagataeibacter oboediens]